MKNEDIQKKKTNTDKEFKEIIENKINMTDRIECLKKRTIKHIILDIKEWFDCHKEQKKWLKYLWIAFLIYRAVATGIFTYEEIVDLLFNLIM